VKNFKKKSPGWRKIIECIDAARFAPMAGNVYTLKFILVSEKDKIAQLAVASQQHFVGSVDYVVAVCSVPSATINAFGKRGEIYFRQQAGAAIQNILLKLTEKKLATCWVGHFSEDHVKNILKVPEEVYVEALLPIGIEAEKFNRKSKKIELDNILYFEKYGKKQMKKEESIS
jgi:nitroreductase